MSYASAALCPAPSLNLAPVLRQAGESLAAVISQPAGFSGMPATGHCSRAATNASWQTSSASPRSPVNRVRTAMSLGDSIRQMASIAEWLPGEADTTPDQTTSALSVQIVVDYLAPVRAVDSSRIRCSCSRNSGVKLSPNSSSSKTWRNSISVPPPKGARFSHSTASSFDLTCQSQKPAINSFVSVKGPSITVRLAPENLTRTPLELG